MIFFYNIIQIAGLIFSLPILLVIAVTTPKYRGRVLRRLGHGLEALLKPLPAGRKRIWFHALSVGEVLSSQPLVKAVRNAYPDSTLIFSAATLTGEQLARQTLKEQVDAFVPFPFDFLFITRRFIRRIAPDLFILVETDFWPNCIHTLNKSAIPCILVNGRISDKSFSRYSRFRFLFKPLFSSFRLISMQTRSDSEKMISLGVNRNRIKTLGNLKYDSAFPEEASRRLELLRNRNPRIKYGIPASWIVWVAGSTHAGEEKIIFNAYKRLSLLFPDLFLLIAPRQTDRCREVANLAGRLGLPSNLRTTGEEAVMPSTSILILDTMGELPEVYSFCDIAFIGGSFVPDGGHNPLEAAAFAKPIIFGPHMEDFEEISGDLLKAGGAVKVYSEDELVYQLHEWLQDKALGAATGMQAKALLDLHRGVTGRHLREIAGLLG